MTQDPTAPPLSRLAVYGFAALLAFLCGFPLLWMVLTSIKPDREILTAIPTFWTSQPTFGCLQRAFSPRRTFLTYFWNSILVAGCTTLLTIARRDACRLRHHPLPL